MNLFWYLKRHAISCWWYGHGEKSMAIGECETCDRIWDNE